MHLCDSLIEIMINLKSQLKFATCVIKHSFYTITPAYFKNNAKLLVSGMTYEMLGDAAWRSNGLINDYLSRIFVAK